MSRAASPGAATLDSRASTSRATAGLQRSRGDVGGTAARAAAQRSARTPGRRTAVFAAAGRRSTRDLDRVLWWSSNPAEARRRTMADTIRQVDYFYIQVPQRAGEAAKA